MGCAVIWSYVELFGLQPLRQAVFVDQASWRVRCELARALQVGACAASWRVCCELACVVCVGGCALGCCSRAGRLLTLPACMLHFLENTPPPPPPPPPPPEPGPAAEPRPGLGPWLKGLL
jgi:hypothetical protein